MRLTDHRYNVCTNKSEITHRALSKEFFFNLIYRYKINTTKIYLLLYSRNEIHLKILNN